MPVEELEAAMQQAEDVRSLKERKLASCLGNLFVIGAWHQYWLEFEERKAKEVQKAQKASDFGLMLDVGNLACRSHIGRAEGGSMRLCSFAFSL